MSKIPEEMAKAEANIAVKAKGKAKGKAVAKAACVVDIVVLGEKDPEAELMLGKKIDNASFMLAGLKLASTTTDECIVPFYGCIRCRFNRQCCINYKCHPEHFQKHFENIPGMYNRGTHQLSVEALKTT